MKFRRAVEMPKSVKRVPVSIRIDENLKKLLVAEAKQGNITLAELIEHTLEDFAGFIKSGKKK